MKITEAITEADRVAREEDRTRRQQERNSQIKRALALHNPFGIPRLGVTEFPAVDLGRRVSKCARAYAVVASSR